MSKAPTHAVVLVLVALGSAGAQEPTGTVTGRVTDPSGAALAGVQVGVTNRDTGQTRTVLTSAEVVTAWPRGLRASTT